MLCRVFEKEHVYFILFLKIWVISMDFSLPYVNFHRGSTFDLGQLSN
jgi:hypothetical protein